MAITSYPESPGSAWSIIILDFSLHSKKWSITKYSATLWVKVYALGILAVLLLLCKSRIFLNPSIIFQVKLVICTFRNDGLSRIWPLCKKRKFASRSATLLIDFGLKQQKILGLLLFQDVSNCWNFPERLVTLLSAKLHYYLNYLQLLDGVLVHANLVTLVTLIILG